MAWPYICLSLGEKMEFLLKDWLEVSDFLENILLPRYPIEITPNNPKGTPFKNFRLLIFIPLILPGLPESLIYI